MRSEVMVALGALKDVWDFLWLDFLRTLFFIGYGLLLFWAGGWRRECQMKRNFKGLISRRYRNKIKYYEITTKRLKLLLIDKERELEDNKATIKGINYLTNKKMQEQEEER